MYLNIKYIKDIISSVERVRKELVVNKVTEERKGNSSYGINERNFLDRSQTQLRQSVTGSAGDNNEEEEQEEMTFHWSDFTLKDKWELFSGWSVIVILGNIITLIASVYLLVSTKTSQRDGEILLGVGGFLVVASLMKYYENVRGYNIILNTMIRSVVIFTKAIIGALPIFLAFAALGNCLFNENERFSSFSMSLMTLFALINGDVIFAAFIELKELNYLVGQWFLFIYLFISIAIIFNIIVVIIGDGYVGKYHQNLQI